jgi:invasion protein IalB
MALMSALWRAIRRAPIEGLSWRDQLSDERLMHSMTQEVSRRPCEAWLRHDDKRGARRVVALFAAAGVALTIAGVPVSAQDAGTAPAAQPAAQPPAAAAAQPAAQPAAKAAAPGADAAQAKAGGDKKRSQWVKLCDKIKISAKPKDGKDAAAKDAKDTKEAKAEPPQEKQLCSTMFEAIESNTGQVIVSVGLQEIEGAPKQVLAVMVPLGIVLPGGVKLAVYSQEQWAKAAKNETVELKDLKTADLKFIHCLPVGCTAETQATKELVDLLKGNAGLAVLAIWANGNQFTIPVPLTGFGEALAGKPVDNKEYQANRQKLMEQIRQRQAELREKFKAEQMKNLPPYPGATGAAGAAAAPAGKDAAATKEAPTK